MGATAQPSPPPAGFEVIQSSEPQKPVVKLKTEPEAPAVEAPEAPAEVAAPVEESSAYDKAKVAAEKAKKGAAANRKLREQGLQLQQQLERQLERQSQHTSTLESQLREASQHLEHVMRDPLGFLKAKGVSPQDLAKRVALDGSPEGQIEALRAELQSTQQQLRAQAEAAREREEATRRAQIENAYKQEAADAAKYPHLATVHHDFILSRTKEIVTELWRRHSADPVGFRRATGYSSPGEIPSSDFLTYLNDTYKPAPQKQATEVATETSGKKTATITNKLASAKHAAPIDFAKMSDRQQKKVMAEQFRQLGIGR